MSLNDIDGINDRRRLLLLIYKGNRSVDDESVIAILSAFYPDFISYRVEDIRRDLEARGLLELVDKHPEMPDTNEEGEENPKYEWRTTPDGERALEVNFFPSEYKERNFDAKRKEKEAENLDLYNKELKRNRIISWAALLISLASIAIAAVAL